MESFLFLFSESDVKWVTLGQLLTTENDRRLGWVFLAWPISGDIPFLGIKEGCGSGSFSGRLPNKRAWKLLDRWRQCSGWHNASSTMMEITNIFLFKSKSRAGVWCSSVV